MTSEAARHVMRLPATLTPEEVIEDLEFLDQNGTGFVEAAHRVGKTTDTCRTFLHRHGRADLVAALRRHDPHTEPPRTVERKSDEWASSHAAFIADCEAARIDALTQWPDDDMTRERRVRCLDLRGGAA